MSDGAPCSNDGCPKDFCYRLPDACLAAFHVVQFTHAPDDGHRLFIGGACDSGNDVVGKLLVAQPSECEGLVLRDVPAARAPGGRTPDRRATRAS